mmetsp:Transcript_2561/g.3398  ORF Transcript_2561/g.3398 Transcript_2561/m.3398 type:complete len:457 (-) Transcript_2561:8-1378(-)
MQTSNMDFVHWMKQANDASMSFFNIPINNFPHVDIRSSNAVHSVASKKDLSDNIRVDFPAPRKVQSVGITFINRQHPIDKSRKLVQKGSITSMCWSKSEQFLATCSSLGDIKIWNVNDWSLVGELLGDHCSTNTCQTELQDLYFAHNDTQLIAAGGKRHIAPCLHDSEEEPFIQVYNIQSLSANLVNSATSFTINVPHLQNASISCLKMLEVEDNSSYFVTIGTDGCILKWKLDPVTRNVSHAEIELPSKLHQAQHFCCEIVVSDSEVCLAIVATEDLYIVSFNTGKVIHTFKNVVGRLATKLDLIEPYAANVHHMVLVPESTAREEPIKEGHVRIVLSISFHNPIDASAKGCGCLMLELDTRDWHVVAASVFSHKEFSLTAENNGSKLNSNGRYLLAPDSKGRVFAWNLKSREIVGIIGDHSPKLIRCSLFHSKFKWFLTAGDESIVRLFEQNTK